jgi:hypothetical protein
MDKEAFYTNEYADISVSLYIQVKAVPPEVLTKFSCTAVKVIS